LDPKSRTEGVSEAIFKIKSNYGTVMLKAGKLAPVTYPIDGNDFTVPDPHIRIKDDKYFNPKTFSKL
jgi:hypothetical protein